MLFEQGELVSKEKFIKAFGELPLGKFIRSILGLDSNAAKAEFSHLTDKFQPKSRQIHFLNTLIDFLTVNGIVDPALLFESPFTEIHSSSIMGLFDEQTSTEILSLLEGINAKAEAA